MAHIEARQRVLDRAEVGLLALAAPFLLFPAFVPAGTLLALVIIPVIWLLRPALTGCFLVRTPFNPALLLFLSTVLVGILVSADPDLTLPKVAGLLLGITLWRTLAVQVRTPGQRQGAVCLFLLAAFGMIFVGAMSVEWRAKVPFIAAIVQNLPESVLRLPGSEPAGTHANQLAGTVLLGWPLSIALMGAAWSGRQARHRPMAIWTRILAGGVAFTGGLLLLLAQSRAGWLGGLAGLGALIWLNWARRAAWNRAQQRLWLTLGGLAFLVLLAVSPFATRWVAARATPGTVGALETVAFRFEVWRYALEAIADFPLTGTGLGTFRRVVLRLYPITAFPNPDVAHAHNVFLQVALDTGLPGLVAYLLLLSAAAHVGWRWLRSAPDDRSALAVGVLATLVAFHVFGLADTIALGAKPGLLFWWLLGLMSSRVGISPKWRNDVLPLTAIRPQE